MSVAEVCDAIAAIDARTTHETISTIASKCESCLNHVDQIFDAVESSLSTSAGEQRLMLWFLVDRLCKQHSLFLDALRPRIIALLSSYAPVVRGAEWDTFTQLLHTSFTVLFGAPLVSLVLMQLGGEEAAMVPGGGGDAGRQPRSEGTLVVHSAALRSAGAFVTKAIAVERDAAHKHTLQVKTIDSQMAMNVASSYAPARPVEILVPELQPDADAPRGFMKPLPSDHLQTYEATRRKRLREVMARNRAEQDRRQEQELLRRVRHEKDEADKTHATPGVAAHEQTSTLLDDIEMPAELPRDEFGVRRGNFPLGVRFIRDAVAECGGAVELSVLVQRLSTLSNREAVAQFGSVREFLLLHSPTFRLEVEGGEWIVRLTRDAAAGAMEPTWRSMQCPGCSKLVKGRNFARHHNSRQCITAQIALGLQGDYLDRGPIAQLAHMAKYIISHAVDFDDDDIDFFAECITRAAAVRRFRLASPRQFAPILKAMRVVRDRWLKRKGVAEVDEATVTGGDAAVVHLFRIFGASVHRLPVAWIEMGDVIDMCHRFSTIVLPPFNPPPRPADPRISLYNEYPGFLLCESEVDDEDEPSGDEDEFSDDEAPTFTFAPPVDVAESLFTAGFARDTRRLQHRMRTAPPMILQRVLMSDRTQTQREMYNDMQRSQVASVMASIDPRHAQKA